MNINLTLFGQLITFVVFVWFTMKFVWNPIVAALETRKKGIADSLAQAERGKHEQELARQRASEILQKAKAEASDIVGNAQKRAAGIVEEAKGDARDEGARILSAARAEIDREVSRAREQLREQVQKSPHKGLLEKPGIPGRPGRLHFNPFARHVAISLRHNRNSEA